VTIPPVLIQGDAGAQQLIKGLDAARNQPSCTPEKLLATLDCFAAGAAALAGVASGTTVIGAAAGVAVTLAASTNCGRALRAVDDCEQQ
jgi:hypothetical protein